MFQRQPKNCAIFVAKELFSGNDENCIDPHQQVKVFKFPPNVNSFMPNTMISVKFLYTVRADYVEQRISCPSLFNSFVLRLVGR